MGIANINFEMVHDMVKALTDEDATPKLRQLLSAMVECMEELDATIEDVADS